jgi:hypothetical protein
MGAIETTEVNMPASLLINYFSLTYGVPIARGGVALPMNPASTIIVSTYGII